MTIARKMLVVIYLVSMIAGAGALLLLTSRLALNFTNEERLKALCSDAMAVGFALLVLSVGLRAMIGAYLWLRSKAEAAHG